MIEIWGDVKVRRLFTFLTAALFCLAIFLPQKTNTADITVNAAGIFNNKLNFVAHRGESDIAPENTVPAFEAAAKDGFWGIETDISETSDGEFVCMHDETIDRTTNGSGMVGEYSLKQIMKLDIDVGSNIANYETLKIPKLSDYLGVCGQYDCAAVIEIKRVKHYKKLMDAIEKSGCRAVITGGIDSLREVRKINKTYPLMLIAYAPGDVKQYVQSARQLGENCGLLLNHPMLGDEAAALIHENNYYCGVWTVNSYKMAADFFDKYGVDFVVADSAACMKKQ